MTFSQPLRTHNIARRFDRLLSSAEREKATLAKIRKFARQAWWIVGDDDLLIGVYETGYTFNIFGQIGVHSEAVRL